MFILPTGNYTFACYPSKSGIITNETRTSITTITRKGVSYFNENLKSGSYYKIVFLSIDTSLNKEEGDPYYDRVFTYRTKLSNIEKEEIIKPSKKYRNLQYTLYSLELLGAVALLLVLL